MSIPGPNDFHILTNLILTTTLWDWTPYYPSFTDEETKVCEGQVKTTHNEALDLSDLESFLLHYLEQSFSENWEASSTL